MSRIPLLVLTLVICSQSAYADFDFYTEQCTKLEKNGCSGPLVDGPRCLAMTQGECIEHEVTRKCDWKQTSQLGLPEWVCEQIEGKCVSYEQVCQQHEKVCTAGYKRLCKKTLKPYSQIKDELTWSIYQSHMKRIATPKKKPIHVSILNELQPYYQVNLATIAISKGSLKLGAGITDCSTIYIQDQALVDTLTHGTTIANQNDLRTILHELRHAQQCTNMGSRKTYAITWFGGIDVAHKPDADVMIQNTVNMLSNLGGKYLHSIMPLEADAKTFVSSTMQSVISATRHGKGKSLNGTISEDYDNSPLRRGPRNSR